MAKTPKLAGVETKAGKLREMQARGLTEAKTFSKGAAKVWSDYSKAFPKGAPKNATFIKSSKEARTACESVNMKTFGDFVVFPTGKGGTASIRETKHGVFVSYGRAGPNFKDYHDEIILSKTGNHIQYGMALAKRRQSRDRNADGPMIAYGTLKTHAYKVGGEMVNGFMRDTARAYEDPMKALLDDRYAEAPQWDHTADIPAQPVTKGFVNQLQETNGVAALIMTRS